MIFLVHVVPGAGHSSARGRCPCGNNNTWVTASREDETIMFAD